MSLNALCTLCSAVAIFFFHAAATESTESSERKGAEATSAEHIDHLPESAPDERTHIQAQQAIMDSYIEEPSLEKAAQILSFPVTNENFTYRIGYYSQLYRRYASQRDELTKASCASPGYIARFAHCAAEWLSGDEACVEDALLQLEYDPIMKGALRIRKNTPRPDFTRLEDLDSGIEEANLLDMAWGAYDATHDRNILLSFIRCAARPAPPEQNAVRFWINAKDSDRCPKPPKMAEIDVVAMAAKWSVSSRAEQDPAFAAKVAECLSSLPADVQERFHAPLSPNPRNDSIYTPNPQ